MKKKVLNGKILIFDLLLLILLVFLDQYTKKLAVLKLKGQSPYSIISGVLEFNYLENRGAAFGLFQDQKILFILIAAVFLLVIFFVILKIPDTKKHRKLHFLIIMIAAGAIGNMIDRIRLDYVVDFIYVVLINFPIFNVADMYVTTATFLLAILVLFVFKEEDLEFLSFKKKEQ